MTVKIRNIILNVLDLEKSKTFWKQVLGFEPIEDSEGWTLLADPDQPGPRVGLQQTDKPKQDFNRLHLDLEPEDGRTEIERLKALGATIPPWQYGPDPDYVVMADPEGNEFCLVAKGIADYRNKL